jgi:hypothetical protein
LRIQDYQQNRKTAGSAAFGQSAFGSTTQPTTTTNLFGQSTQPQPTGSIFNNSFGNTGASNATTGGAFGGLGQTPTQTTGGFGAFNQPSQPPQQPATGGFGSFNQPQQPQNTGLFGSSNTFASQNKPLGGFGTSCNQHPYRRLTMVQAILGALEVVLMPVPLAFLGKTMPRNNLNLPPLLVSLDRVNQLVVHLVGVHLVRRVCY